MTHLLDANPSIGSINARPLQPHEIDALDCADRVWATIGEIRSAMDAIIQEEADSFERLIDDAKSSGEDAGYADAQYDLDIALTQIGLAFEDGRPSFEEIVEIIESKMK